MNPVVKVDVIIPSFNRADLLVRAIDSVLKQSHPHFSVHVVDDGSTDKTQESLLKYKNESRVFIHTIPNSGVSRARNFGVRASGNEWICFLDSDDEWTASKLEEQIRYSLENPEIAFIHTEEVWMRKGVRVNPKIKHSKQSNDIFKRSLEFCLISPSTVMMKRSLFMKYGPFDEELKVCEDFDLWNKILAHEAIGFLPENLTIKYGGHEDQLSTQYFAMDYWRIKSLVKLFHSDVSGEQKSMIRDILGRKAEILLKGYQKHQNMNHYEEIKELLDSVI